MLRGYRSILAAIAGLTLLAASPSNQNQAIEHGEASGQIGDTTSPAPVVEPTRPDNYEKSCDQGQDNRSSDLCAQWKAADAAAEAADAAWTFGWIGSGIGLLTLIAAALAAKFARDAAIHTEAGATQSENAAKAATAANELSEQMTRRQDRAYLTVRPDGISNLIARDTVIGRVLLENVGKTPAHNVFLDVRMSLLDADGDFGFEDAIDPRHSDRTLQPGAQMPQGSARDAERMYYTAAQAVEDGKALFVWGIAYYDDIFGERHFTKFCHRYRSGSYERDAFRKITTSTRERIMLFLPGSARFYRYWNEAD